MAMTFRPDELHAANPGLVLLRTTGFGQDGPYARRRAFGSLAEAMTGFAHLTGPPDGPPSPSVAWTSRSGGAR